MRARDRKVGVEVVHHPGGAPFGKIVKIVGKQAMMVQKEGGEPRLASIHETQVAK